MPSQILNPNSDVRARRRWRPLPSPVGPPREHRRRQPRVIARTGRTWWGHTLAPTLRVGDDVQRVDPDAKIGRLEGTGPILKVDGRTWITLTRWLHALSDGTTAAPGTLVRVRVSR